MHIPADAMGPTEASRELGLSRARVIQLANMGRLRAIRTPLGRLFEREEVERLVRERATREKAGARRG